MLIVKIKAGLGNQMFQYAFGKALSRIRNEDLFLDISSYENQAEREAKREFLLEHFNINCTILSKEEALKQNTPLLLWYRKVLAKLQKRDAYTFYPKLLSSREKYYEGYFLNHKYFQNIENEIRHDFTLRNSHSAEGNTIAQLINNSAMKNCTVSLHIRRGDFVSNPNSAFNGVLGIPYYEKAMKTLQEKLPSTAFQLFVFSDDIEWAKENLKLNHETTFVSHPNINDFEELILMSLCSHNIIANSTFSWWGAFLNPNKEKVVIAPFQWLKEKTVTDLLLEGWIAI